MMRMVTLVTAVMKAGKGNPGLEGGGSGMQGRRQYWDAGTAAVLGCRDGGSGSFRSRWEGENMKCVFG